MILIACLLAYMLVAPDRKSLALSRGLAGAAHGALTGRTPKMSKTAEPSPRGRALKAGWREGVATARERREAGKDLWSRGSRGTGRVYGGMTSLVSGVRETVDRRRAGSRELEEGATSPDAVPARRGWSVAHLVKRPRTKPTSEGTTDGTEPIGTKPAAPTDAKPDPAPEKTPEPKPAPAPAPATDTTSKTPETAPKTDLAKPASAPDTPSNPSRIGDNRMTDLLNIELTDIDALDKYLKALQSVFEDLEEQAERVKKHGKHLASEWEGAGWGTRGLDRAINDIVEEIASFKVPAGEAFATGCKEIAEARGLGETVETVKARGNTQAFTGN